MTARDIISVVCAVILKDNKILIAKRSENMSMSGKWEFPGGKIENEEDAQSCLRREIQEELGVEINICDDLGEYLHDYGQFKVSLHAFSAELIAGTPSAREHSEIKWVTTGNLNAYDFTEADLPVIRVLINKGSGY